MKAPAPGAKPGRAGTSEQQTKSTAFIVETPARPTFVLRLEPLPGVDGHRALRELLKRARRDHGLVCRAYHEVCPSTAGSDGAPDGLHDRRAAWLAEAERRAGR